MINRAARFIFRILNHILLFEPKSVIVKIEKSEKIKAQKMGFDKGF